MIIYVTKKKYLLKIFYIICPSPAKTVTGHLLGFIFVMELNLSKNKYTYIYLNHTHKNDIKQFCFIDKYMICTF